MNSHRDNFPMRTLFVSKSIFYPYAKLDNGKFPWEDTRYTANRIGDILKQNGVVYSVHELLRVRFSREIATLIGGKKLAKQFLTDAFGLVKEANQEGPNFIEIELHAPQK